MTTVRGVVNPPGDLAPSSVRLGIHPTGWLWTSDAGVDVAGIKWFRGDKTTGAWSIDLEPTPTGCTYTLVTLPDDGERAKRLFTVPSAGGPYNIGQLYVPGQQGGAQLIIGAVGSALTVVGTALPALPSGREYVWFATDGAGRLLDILTGVAP